jgi:predicted O-methyltransferase YrrM
MKVGTTPFMAVKEYEYIRNVINSNNLKTVLEWGSGASTLWFSQNCNIDKWTAIEHNKGYYDYIKNKVNDKVELRLLEGKDYININGKFDFILIDGVNRDKCLYKAFSLLSNNPQARIILHDSGRKAYKEWYLKYQHKTIFEGEGWLGDGWDHRGLVEFRHE